ncbi:MAG TPA: hypothetical protein VFQ53_00905 [Kofleriaceae bacterium]|nr:hypothetical protein [Kofleriaceae bacterium]
MRPTILALLVTSLGLAACSKDEQDCSDNDSCKVTEQKYGLTERTIHDSQTKDFVAGGITYTLVRVEYGDTPECDLFDENCTYSWYCGWVVDNQDYPLEVHWVTDADALFDPTTYCEDGEIEGCELPGQTLPILDDEDFEDWMYDTDPDDDVLVDCFADYY